MFAVRIGDWRCFAALLPLAAACSAWAQQPPATTDLQRVAAETLRRTKIVAPFFPKVARDNAFSGFVQLNFTIEPDGSVTDVQVVAAEPQGVFEESAIKALSQWRYEPPSQDGEPVALPATYWMKFVYEVPVQRTPDNGEPLFKQSPGRAAPGPN